MEPGKFKELTEEISSSSKTGGENQDKSFPLASARNNWVSNSKRSAQTENDE